jgi:hypothetical protein
VWRHYAQPWENYLFALVAIVIVLLNRTAMLTRAQAVTAVVPNDHSSRPDPAPQAQAA